MFSVAPPRGHDICTPTADDPAKRRGHRLPFFFIYTCVVFVWRGLISILSLLGPAYFRVVSLHVDVLVCRCLRFFAFPASPSEMYYYRTHSTAEVCTIIRFFLLRVASHLGSSISHPKADYTEETGSAIHPINNSVALSAKRKIVQHKN